MEFALLAPVMVLLFFGTVEVVQAVQAHRKLAHVSAAIGEIVARERTLGAGEVEDILSAGPAMMAPFPARGLGLRVMSFSADERGTVRLDWQAAGPAYAGDALPGLGGRPVTPGESVIVTDASYAYTPVFNLPLSRPLTFQKRTIHRPRLARAVELD
ncbi:TadE/TadG family type IV pilus assembly protein [Phenylobacterium sp.]|uniref:TadE/TadG family type IV pilus assembly protein n=1 Tax=Phenylobacterium sp. TaxID=1871053 RepID=UPI002C9BAE72|nr:TadE/TadG family type IV pilus assembly protein [Phenylobacterium sp.]HVI31066.1 TadE/TadG family type IV pilus assembly protein [Phenylobacterium sp.]